MKKMFLSHGLTQISVPHLVDAALLRRSSVLFAGNLAETRDNLLPAFAHVVESDLVGRHDKAGMHQAKPRAAFDPGKNPGDDGVQPGAVSDVAVVAASPGIG